MRPKSLSKMALDPIGTYLSWTRQKLVEFLEGLHEKQARGSSEGPNQVLQQPRQQGPNSCTKGVEDTQALIQSDCFVIRFNVQLVGWGLEFEGKAWQY